MADHLKALTIRQPWASLIMAGIKDVENRTWRTNYRGRLVIHAGARDDRQAVLRHAHLLDGHQIIREGDCEPSKAYRAPLPYLPRGALLGTVELIDCVRDSESEWAIEGQWHWQLADPQPFETAIPAKGRLGLWQCVVSGTSGGSAPSWTGSPNWPPNEPPNNYPQPYVTDGGVTWALVAYNDE
ncbi:MAG: ASCH domain-containing protein [Acidimicrobiales bacterium]